MNSIEIIKDSIRLSYCGMNLKQSLFIRLSYLKEKKDKLDLDSLILEELFKLEEPYFQFILKTEIENKQLLVLVKEWYFILLEWIKSSELDVENIVDKMLDIINPLTEEIKELFHQKIAVSACLTGVNCKYNGGNNHLELLDQIKDRWILICPEMQGGLSCPRDPSEIKDFRVISSKGKDVTDNFMLGARKALSKIQENQCSLAILKAKSPSCGYGQIYDGTFTSTLINGNGITADLFIKNNIVIINEKEFEWIMNLKWD